MSQDGPTNPDRRTFLVQTGKFILLTGAAGIAWDALRAGTPEKAANYQLTDHWWAMTIDVDKCIGSGNCVRACKQENDVLNEPGNFRTWVERYQVRADDPDNPIVDSPNGGHDGFQPLENPPAGTKVFFVPKMCNHCADSPCTQVCPVGATFETKDGVVLIDKEYCLGCRYCVQACPYGCRYIDPRTNTADKCTLCYHRLTRGLQPACCEACPTGARQIADLKNPDDPVHEFLRTHQIQILKPQMATGAKVYYNGLDGSVR
jgi:Fe-S-cluster-containing dehydrogenase component